MKQNIAVIFGGKSSEHDISIITASQVLKNLNKQKYNIIPVYITKSGKWFYLKKFFDISFFSSFNVKNKGVTEVGLFADSNTLFKKRKLRHKQLFKIDVAIVAMHGVNGEDGTVAGLLQLCDIPFTSPGSISAGICMDKVFMKKIFESEKFPVLPYVHFYRSEFLKAKEKVVKRLEKELDYPIIIKPANLGSSIGINICRNFEELVLAIEVACHYDKKILAERAVENLREINCSVLGVGQNVKASELEEPVSWKSYLSFEEKYLTKNKNSKGGMHNLKRIMPAKISKKISKQIKALSLKAFKALNCKGVVRIDYIIDEDENKVYINEINTIPGSFAFYLWEYEGMSFETLLDELIKIAKIDKLEKQKNTYTYSSSVLNFNGKGKSGIK